MNLKLVLPESNQELWQISNIIYCNNKSKRHWNVEWNRARQDSSSQIQYLSNSTKITTNTETEIPKSHLNGEFLKSKTWKNIVKGHPAGPQLSISSCCSSYSSDPGGSQSINQKRESKMQWMQGNPSNGGGKRNEDHKRIKIGRFFEMRTLWYWEHCH